MSPKSNTPEKKKKNESPSCFLQIVPAKGMMMELPRGFVDKHGRRLSGIATFYAAGEPWQVGILKSEAGVLGSHEIRMRIWFSDGFGKFLQHYSIEANNLIFFKYKGDSEFDLVVIDKDSGCSDISPPEYEMCFLKEVRDEKMMLPLEFVNEYGRQLSLYLTLNVANGKNWPISLTKSATGVLGPPNKIRMKICIEDGIKEFLQHYSIKPAQNLIIFKYKGESEFDVDIIDQKSHCEINYGKIEEIRSPKREDEQSESRAPEVENPKRYVEIIDVDVDVDDESENHSAEEGSPKHSMEVQSVIDEVDESNESRGPEPCGGDEEKFSRLMKKYPNIFITNKFTSSTPVEAHSRASSFVKNLNPKRPSFLVYLYPPMMRYGYMRIPNNFFEKYMNGATKARVEVANVEDESWELNIIKNTKGFIFKKGWSQFAKENGLDGGEILIFELASEKGASSIVLKVHINRVGPSEIALKPWGSKMVRGKIGSSIVGSELVFK